MTQNNFSNVANNVSEFVNDLLLEVAEKLSSQKDEDALNVKRFADLKAEESGYDAVMISAVIRGAVNACDDFKSRRGPNGGVMRVVATPTEAVQSEAVQSEAVQSEAVQPDALDSAEKEIPEEVSSEDLDEILSAC